MNWPEAYIILLCLGCNFLSLTPTLFFDYFQCGTLLVHDWFTNTMLDLHSSHFLVPRSIMKRIRDIKSKIYYVTR